MVQDECGSLNVARVVAGVILWYEAHFKYRIGYQRTIGQ